MKWLEVQLELLVGHAGGQRARYPAVVTAASHQAPGRACIDTGQVPGAVRRVELPSVMSSSDHATPHVVVIGAGPAGLTAAYQLATRYGIASTVLEADSVVGGISRTVERDGWRFDIGGHRFFTKVKEVEALWHEILADEDFLLRPRMSRVFLNGKYMDYPLRAGNVLKTLGLVESFRVVGSYAWARVRPPKDQTNYEGWLVARFGRRLYGHVFKTYTEKLWGVPVDKLPSDFAAQRVKNLSFMSAAINAVLPKRNQKDITSLIEEFQYPKYGPGMMWERCRDLLEAEGGRVLMNTRVVGIRHEGGRAVAVISEGADGERTEHPCTHVISSMPISHLLQAMDPPASDVAVRAAGDLRYRDFLTVALVVPEDCSFPDNWIYVHSKEVGVGRIQNFGSWSPYLVKEGRTCLGLEFFVFEGDETWTRSDEDLIEQGKRELGILGLVDPDVVESGYVVRMPKAYPFYDEHYKANVARIVEWLDDCAPNVHPVGRNGMHRYNNQDHSMLTAMLTAENIATGSTHDVWSVNVEEEYHEEGAADTDSPRVGTRGTGRDAPVISREHYGADHPLNRPADSVSE
ncbi:MAG: Gll1135 protein [uncultured Acidimicrobiales bacterium]|uniref:Gll1135 protein n=1 Tax=uncultured Acidimicrobiales bacterium TaxID=310071 RepID=A0A6J4HSD6_9ACTN|nr:MAG: Gll1135 protein [uncultured Acidimicrobiales bacterium]